MQRFNFPGLPARVVFGAGTIASLGAEIDRLAGPAFLIHTARNAELVSQLCEDLSSHVAGRFDGPQMHTPIAVSEGATAAFAACDAKCLVALGGGSAIGLAKAIALRTGAPIIAIPTSYAGSEMTDILGQTEGSTKTTLRDPVVRPKTVIYDVDLTRELPLPLSVASGFNAMSHAVDGLFAPEIDPLSKHLAEQCVLGMTQALPRLRDAKADPQLREQLLVSAWYGSMVLASQPMALQHKLAHVIGGRLNTDHADTHAALLPYTTGFNAGAAGERLTGLHPALGPSMAAGLWDFAEITGAPRSLAAIGVRETDLTAVADAALATTFANPRPLRREDLLAMLHAAWRGERPA